MLPTNHLSVGALELGSGRIAEDPSERIRAAALQSSFVSLRCYCCCCYCDDQDEDEEMARDSLIEWLSIGLHGAATNAAATIRLSDAREPARQVDMKGIAF